MPKQDSPSAMRHFSIRFRLSLGFFVFLFLVIFLGAFGIACLNNFDAVTDQIRNRWLPNTRFLGDLNNYTSDFRAAEGTLLLASGPADAQAGEQEMEALDRAVARAQRGYEQVYHDEAETRLYERFAQDWAGYRDIVNQVISLMHQNRKEEGAVLYKTTSQSAYNAASDTLGRLTDLNIAQDGQASDRAAQTYSKVRFLMGLTMLSAVLLVTVGVLYIRRSISGPILDLAANMHRLAGNDRDVEITAAQRRDEVGEMARAVQVFRDNAIELALSREGLIQQAAMLEEKLEHERSLMGMQRNFITMASHEFRTPLNIIDGHAQRLIKMKHALTPESIAERAGKIRGAVEQMTDLIENLIRSTLLFEGKPELYYHPALMDLGALLHEVCHQHREIVPLACVVEHIPAQPMMMRGDARLLRQVFSNLLSNAIKYSPENSLIEVTAEISGADVQVRVRDRGIGIPVKDIEAVFGRYARGSNVAGISGSGIGLYLARMVVELHGGDIAVESGEGEGSVFTVRLPVDNS